MKRIFAILGFVAFAVFVASAQLTFNANDLLGVKRVADPQLSPDGKWVAFTIGVVNKEANKVVNQIYIVGVDGSKPRQITTGSSSNATPRWSPDGKRLAFTAGGQVWTMKADGSDREQGEHGEHKDRQPVVGDRENDGQVLVRQPSSDHRLSAGRSAMTPARPSCGP